MFTILDLPRQTGSSELIQIQIINFAGIASFWSGWKVCFSAHYSAWQTVNCLGIAHQSLKLHLLLSTNLITSIIRLNAAFFKRVPILGLYYIFYLATVFGLFSSRCVFTRASSVWKEIDPFPLHLSGVLKSENVYSCTQCWHLKSGKMGYHGSGVYAPIVFFSSSFHRPWPRRTKFPSNWMPAKSRWSGHWDPVFYSMVQHKHSILFVGAANMKYLNQQG